MSYQNFRYKAGDIVDIGYCHAEILRISEFRAYDYRVKLIYNKKIHPMGASRIHGQKADLVERIIKRKIN